jgi:hypothetical protein
LTEQRQFDEIKGIKYDARVTLVIGVVLLATLSAAILLIQLAYAQSTVTNKAINSKLGNKTYAIKYQITGGNLTAISAAKDNITLLLNISSTSNGRLTIELPRNIIDSRKQGNVDDNFTVFEDGQYVAADEIRTNPQTRTLMVGFDNGTSVIEITGTQMVPEFTAVAVGIFAISIISMIVATGRYNGIVSNSKRRRD